MSELLLLKRVYDKPVVQRIISVLAKKTGGTFGFAEAIVFARAVDFWMRYQSVLRVLPEGLVLDVGCGKLGIGSFIGGDRTIALDVTTEVRSAAGQRIIASAGALPFRPKVIPTFLQNIPLAK